MHTFKNIMAILLAVLFGTGSAFGQLSDRNDRQNSSSASQQQSQSIMSQLPTGKIIQDGPVDPKEYIVGPGDIFSVNIWAATPLMFQVPVTPEGSVIIPTVAELKIAGMTLDSAKRIVMSEIRKKYISGNASFTLFSPRSFTVTVLGAVLNEGTVVVQSTQRVDAALLLANDVQKFREITGANTVDPKQSKDIQKKLISGSRRNIVINRKNGTVVKADIEKYQATLNSAFNPLLLDGDIVIVQPKNIEKDYIGIYGAVSKEGNYEFVEGDSVSGLVRMSGGMTAFADGGKAILYRTTGMGNQEYIGLNLESILQKKNTDVPLWRGDRLIVQKKIAKEQGGIVIVEGEVNMPGSYPILRDTTTLFQVIAMAGGLTPYASLSSSRVLRNRKIEQVEIDSVNLKRGITTLEDRDYLLHEIKIQSYPQIVQTDFLSLFEKNDNSKDIKLMNGDKVIVATKTNTVYVFGEIRNPGFVVYTSGKDADFYVAQCGGYTDRARKNDMRIIKAISKQWLAPGETKIEEGDFVWVPNEPYRPFEYYLNIYSQMFGIVGTVATLFLLISK